MSKAAEVIESLKKQLADMSSDEECVWPACILGTDEAQALVDAFTVPEERRVAEALACMQCTHNYGGTVRYCAAMVTEGRGASCEACRALSSPTMNKEQS